MKGEDYLYIGVKVYDEELKKKANKLKPLEGLSLRKQCKRAEIPLETIELSAEKGDDPELQAKKYLLEKENYDEAYFMESRFTMLFQIMFFDYILDQFKKDPDSLFLEVNLWDYMCEDKNKPDLINNVRNMDANKLKNNMELINRESLHPEEGWLFVYEEEKQKFLNIFSAISKENLVKASKLYIVENSFYKGWPDLVTVKSSGNSGLKFFEVKTTDNLMTHQTFIIRCFQDKAGFNMRVLKLNFN